MDSGFKNPDYYGPFSMKITGNDLMMMAIEGVIFFALTFLLEYLYTKEGFNRYFSAESAVPY